MVRDGSGRVRNGSGSVWGGSGQVWVGLKQCAQSASAPGLSSASALGNSPLSGHLLDFRAFRLGDQRAMKAIMQTQRKSEFLIRGPDSVTQGQCSRELGRAPYLVLHCSCTLFCMQSCFDSYTHNLLFYCHFSTLHLHHHQRCQQDD